MTTIDYTIQNIAEQALKEFNDVIKTKSSSVVVMDPNTGEILAPVTERECTTLQRSSATAESGREI